MTHAWRRVMGMWWVMTAACVACNPSASKSADVPSIAAAADLSAALPEIVQAFTRQTGRSVTLVFGSSGRFAQQIENGAPFELFLSADEQYVQSLALQQKTDGEGALYAVGRIGLFLPRGSGISTDTSMAGLVAAVRRGDVTRLAIANPAHAPYGRAAREALQDLGIWEAVESRLVLGENAAQATQFAMSGNVQGGIIPLALALTPEVRAAGTFVPIVAQRHTPLRQRVVMLTGAGETAREFYDFLQSPVAREIFERYGFVLPGR